MITFSPLIREGSDRSKWRPETSAVISLQPPDPVIITRHSGQPGNQTHREDNRLGEDTSHVSIHGSYHVSVMQIHSARRWHYPGAFFCLSSSRSRLSLMLYFLLRDEKITLIGSLAFIKFLAAIRGSSCLGNTAVSFSPLCHSNY